MLYTIASAHAWQIKEWFREPISLWVFVVMGIAGSVGGIIRGHLIFTDVMNRPHLTSELARTKRVRLFTDVLMALLLTVDALLLHRLEAADGGAHDRCSPPASRSAAVLMEPATTAALLGE